MLALIKRYRLVRSYSSCRSDNYNRLVDEIRIKVSGGKGGDGCVSFLREKYKPKGPPAGGDGGKGGDVYVVAQDDIRSLIHVPYRVAAGKGLNGSGKLMHGKKGNDVILRVPVGTVIFDITPKEDTNKKEDRRSLSQEEIDQKRKETWVHLPNFEETNLSGSFFKEAQQSYERMNRPSRRRHSSKSVFTDGVLDLNKPTDSPILLAKGGLGGLGNPHFLTQANRSPKFATRGQKGSESLLKMELKTVADVGFIGLPNAGKSTLLNALTRARSQVADYPFTTLTPQLGVIMSDLSSTATDVDAKPIILADIPGLIKGASEDVGLGHAFLKHISRCTALVFVLDLSADPIQDFFTLTSELTAYGDNLDVKHRVVVGNKADIVDQERWESVKTELLSLDPSIIALPCSAKEGMNLHNVVSHIRAIVNR